MKVTRLYSAKPISDCTGRNSTQWDYRESTVVFIRTVARNLEATEKTSYWAPPPPLTTGEFGVFSSKPTKMWVLKMQS